MMGCVSVAHSATNAVTSLADNGSGSLRQVIQNSAPGDTIIFSVTGTIVLTNGELAVAKNLTIRGPGASALAISGNYSSRVLNISQTANVFISDLTIGSGQTADGTTTIPPAPGGGIYNAGTLVVSNCVVSGNATGNDPYGHGGVHHGNGGDGGGIYLGTLNLTGTIVSGNRAGNGGSSSGIGGNGGGIYNGGTLNMSGSTISGNTAGSGGTASVGGDGGGIYLGAGQCVVSNCVFSGNYAGSGGGGNTDGKYYGGTGALGGNGGGISCHNAGTW